MPIYEVYTATVMIGKGKLHHNRKNVRFRSTRASMIQSQHCTLMGEEGVRPHNEVLRPWGRPYHKSQKSSWLGERSLLREHVVTLVIAYSCILCIYGPRTMFILLGTHIMQLPCNELVEEKMIKSLQQDSSVQQDTPLRWNRSSELRLPHCSSFNIQPGTKYSRDLSVCACWYKLIGFYLACRCTGL